MTILKSLKDWNPQPGDAFAYWCRGLAGGRTGDVRVFLRWSIEEDDEDKEGIAEDGRYMDRDGCWELIGRQEELKVEDFV